MTSSSSTEPLIAGFRLEREIGRGARGVVYEATQLSLDRRVALRLLPYDAALAARLRNTQWPDHANVVPTYAAGECDDGLFVATRLVQATTLDRLRFATPAQVGQLRAGLDAVHAAGLAHGALTGHNVFVDDDGRVLLADAGLGPDSATVADDRAALDALVRTLRVRPAHIRMLAIVGVVGLAIVAVGLATRSHHTRRAPGVASVDCTGGAPDGSSPACTLVQVRLPGTSVAAGGSGTIRTWTVVGARGSLSLQVVHPRGRGYVWRARTPFIRVPDEGKHVLPAELPVRAGDMIAVNVAPGAAIGVRNTSGSALRRWVGVRNISNPTFVPSAPIDGEMVVDADFVARATPHIPGRLTGRAAARADRGVVVASQDVELRDQSLRTVTVNRVGGRVAIDLFSGGRRLVRVPIMGADPRGRLVDLGALGLPIAHVEWLNPGGRTVVHDYAVGARTLEPIS
jgi:hypothetical protein